MVQPLLRLILTRGLLVAAPFVVWFLWSAWAKRTGRPMGSTPWAWLTAAAGVLVGVSLIGSALFHRDNRAEHYVPGEVAPDGHVAAGHFEKP